MSRNSADRISRMPIGDSQALPSSWSIRARLQSCRKAVNQTPWLQPLRDVISGYPVIRPRAVLYQGTTSVVPQSRENGLGFSP
jgi:hypothetical protein